MEHDVVRIDVRKKLHSIGGEIVLDVKTELSAGSLTAVFGPSGSGKTTLLRMLAGLTRPDEGSIVAGSTTWFDSRRGIDVPPQQRNIGMMFQDYALFPNMTVDENIRFAQKGRDDEFSEQLLAILGLAEFRGRRPSRLSGGQKQRAALARALARRPRLLLLDEPLSAVDAAMRTALQNEIGKVHRVFGSTTVLVSHDLHEVFRLATSVVKIEDGKAEVVQSPEDIFTEGDGNGFFSVTGRIESIAGEGSGFMVSLLAESGARMRVQMQEQDIGGAAEGDTVRIYARAYSPVFRARSSG